MATGVVEVACTSNLPEVPVCKLRVEDLWTILTFSDSTVVGNVYDRILSGVSLGEEAL